MRDIVLIPIRTCGLTIQQLVQRATDLKREYPDCEILMDGDSYAIVARPREYVSYLAYRSMQYRAMLKPETPRIKGAVA